MLNDLHTSLLLPHELNTTAERINTIIADALPDDIFIQKVCGFVKTSKERKFLSDGKLSFTITNKSQKRLARLPGSGILFFLVRQCF